MKWILAPLLLLIAHCLIAAPIPVTDPSGKVLLGFNQIEIGGNPYDARFVDGSFEDIFTETTGYDRFGYPITNWFFDFGRGNQSGANSASTALLEAIDLFPQWDDRQDGYSIFGVGGREYWRLMTPYDFIGASIESPGSLYAAGVGEAHTSRYAAFDYVLTGTVYPYDPNAAATNTDFQFSSMDVWVDWSVSPVSVPAPLALLGLGLAGIGYHQRKQIKVA